MTLTSTPEKKGIAGIEVSKSKYLDMFLPEISTQDFSDNKTHGLRDLPKLSTAKQVQFVHLNHIGIVNSACILLNILNFICSNY
jgi:hypothetical protein